MALSPEIKTHAFHPLGDQDLGLLPLTGYRSTVSSFSTCRDGAYTFGGGGICKLV
jgi:hypothetical protein